MSATGHAGHGAATVAVAATEAAAAVCPAAWGSEDVAPATLRKLFGAYPTGVAIVTSRSVEGRKVGLTINSFASLSLDPPLVLWSLVNHSPSLAVFRDCRHFAINILAGRHEELARRFANPSVVDKFESVPVQETPEGVPALDGALTTLVCALDHARTVGDHLLMVGRVVRAATQPGDPLVFHAGRFVSITAPHPANLPT
ncbi:MAG: flavin reductase family protein [Lautropia sp.]|nr:flavin reductase family protein [Lautropia sp.]